MVSLLTGSPGVLAAEPESNPRAEAEYQQLAERARAPGGDSGSLAEEMRGFLRRYPGSAQGVKVAALLSELPSALDKLDPARIADLEKFEWQPKEMVAVLGEHRGRHGGDVSSVAFSADGKWAASGGDYLVRIWDPTTMRLADLASHGSTNVLSIAFSPDSKLLASGNSHGIVRVWEVSATGQLKLRSTTNATSTAIRSVSFAPNSTHLAAATGDNQVHVYDVTGPKTKQQAIVPAHTKGVSAVAYSPDGKWLASAGGDQAVKLWRLADNIPQELATLEGHTTAVTALAFSPTSGLLASGSADGTVFFWGIPSSSRARPRSTCQVAKTAVNCLTFSSSGRTLAAGYADGLVRFWMVTAVPRERGRLAGHVGPVKGLAYGRENQLMVTGGADWTVRSWDLTTPQLKQRFEPWSHLSIVYSADFSPDCKTLASGSLDTVLRLWDMDRDEPRTRSYLKGDSIPLYRVAYSPDGMMVAAGGNSRVIRQWDAASGRPARSCSGISPYLRSLAYTPDGKFLLAGQNDAFTLFDRADGSELRRCSASETGFHSSALSPDGRQVLTGSGGYLYEGGKRVLKDGRAVFTDCVLRLWDLDSGEEVASDKSHTVPIYGTIFLPGTQAALSSAYDGDFRKWLVGEKTLTEQQKLEGMGNYSARMDVSPDGRKLLIHHSGGSLTLWDPATMKRLQTWSLRESIASTTFASDSRHVAICLRTGVIYILRLSGPKGTGESK